MDYFKLLSLLPAIMRIGPTIQNAVKSGASVNTVITLINDPDIQSVFRELGSQLFPNAKQEQATTAAVVSTYDVDYTKTVQDAMNKLLKPSPNLKVDGHYGELTKAAVTRFQQANGLVVDGWAGANTMAKIKAELGK
jgi:murein L,D-transpeptidase YcbB/YkuD